MPIAHARGTSGIALMAALALAAGAIVLSPGAPEAVAAPTTTILDSPVDDVYDARVAPDGTTYAVGDFSEVGAATGGIARLDAADGDVDRTFPTVNGIVNAMVADSDGTIYLGGDFISVGGQPRQGLARINPDGSVDSWAPQIGGNGAAVNALAIDDDTLYVGGFFASINGEPRTSLAAIDKATGQTLSWAPGVSGSGGSVSALATDDTHLYVGGAFESIAGQSQKWVAAFTLSDASFASSWRPDLGVYGVLYTITTHGGLVYIGGEFTSVDSQTRNRIAALDATSGAPTSWAPNADGSVAAIAIDDTIAYIGGNFFHVNGGASRMRLAAVRTDDTGTATSWNPNLNLNGNTDDLLLTDTSVYVAAPSLAKISRAGAGAVDNQWQPRTPSGGSSAFKTLLLQGSSVITSGNFTHVNVVERNGAAAFDTSMRVTPWNPDIDGSGYRIALVGNVAYVVGYFTTVNGSVNRDYAAAFNLDDTGTATSWAPALDSYPYDMDVVDSVAYLVGDFSDINGQTRNYAGAVRIDDTGSVTAWDPDIGGSAYAIDVEDGVGYIGGSFSNVKGGSVYRNNLAAFTTSGAGTPTTWDPDANSDVHEILIHDGVAYIGGGFDALNVWGGSGTVRWRAASVSLDDSGAVTSWDPDIHGGDVFAIQVSGSYAYMSGSFDRVNGSVSRMELAAVNTDDTGTVSDTWIPVANGGFSYGSSYEGGLRLAGDRLLVMGAFYMATLDGADYPGALAALPVIPSTPPVPATPVVSSAPRDARAAAGDKKAEVSWRAPAQQGSFPVSSYQVTSSPGGRICLTSALSCTVSGLTNGTSYTFTVKALTGAGWSAASDPSNAVTPSRMPQPSILISGTRTKRIAMVSGTTTGFGMGAILTPWIRLSATGGFQKGKTTALVSAEGTFTWERGIRPGRPLSVYFTGDGVRSNTLLLPPPG